MDSRLHVGNLPYSVTEEELRQLFSQAGTVRSVSLPIDRLTGRPRGFAFIEMSNHAEAQAAIKGVNGTQHGGRTLNVNEAKPKTNGGGGGGGGGFGGRGGQRW